MNTLDAIIKRKSVRNFNNEQISKEQLEKLIQAANAAPISGGGRPGSNSARHIAVIQNGEILKTLAEGVTKLIPNPTPLYNSQTLIVISAPSNQYKAEQLDVAISAQNISLAATDIGLNSIIMTGVISVLSSNKDLQNKLGIPNGYTPYISIAIGYTDDTSVKIREYHDNNVSYIL